MQKFLTRLHYSRSTVYCLLQYFINGGLDWYIRVNSIRYSIYYIENYIPAMGPRIIYTSQVCQLVRWQNNNNVGASSSSRQHPQLPSPSHGLEFHQFAITDACAVCAHGMYEYSCCLI